MNGSAPKIWRTGSQSLLVTKPRPNSPRLSAEARVISSAIAAISAMTSSAKPAVSLRNSQSPRFPRPPMRANHPLSERARGTAALSANDASDTRQQDLAASLERLQAVFDFLHDRVWHRCVVESAGELLAFMNGPPQELCERFAL